MCEASDRKNSLSYDVNDDWLSSLLKQEDLIQFYNKIIDDLHVTQIGHLEYVKIDDLVKIGMSAPAARRLFAAIEKSTEHGCCKKNFMPSLKNMMKPLMTSLDMDDDHDHQSALPPKPKKYPNEERVSPLPAHMNRNFMELPPIGSAAAEFQNDFIQVSNR